MFLRKINHALNDLKIVSVLYKMRIGALCNRYIKAVPGIAFCKYPGMAGTINIFGNKQYTWLYNKGIAVSYSKL